MATETKREMALRLAREAGAWHSIIQDCMVLCEPHFERLISLARAEAFEDAAKECDRAAASANEASMYSNQLMLIRARQVEAEECAKAIRAKAQEERDAE